MLYNNIIMICSKCDRTAGYADDNITPYCKPCGLFCSVCKCKPLTKIKYLPKNVSKNKQYCPLCDIEIKNNAAYSVHMNLTHRGKNYTPLDYTDISG
jgi:hypothetical protein